MVTGATIQDAFSLSMVMLMIYTMFQEGGMLSVVKKNTSLVTVVKIYYPLFINPVCIDYYHILRIFV